MDEYPEFSSQNTDLTPCGFCGRTFNPETLARHEKVCKKNALKQRKVFDSSKQRSVNDVKKLSKSQPVKQPEPRKSNWRQKHQDFIQSIRAARGVTQAIKEGKELPPPPPPTINPDYIQCPHCSRRFNESAAERHIKFCADQHKRLETRNKGKTVATIKAAEKQDRRTSYRPPLLASGVRRAGNSNASGYSNSNQQMTKVQRPPVRAKTEVTIQGRRSNKPMSRYTDENTFDTSLPQSGVAITRTGLKTKASSNTEYSSKHHSRRIEDSLHRPSNSPDSYVPTTNARPTRNGAYLHKPTSHPWDSDFNSNPEKKVVTRKISNMKSRDQSSVLASNGYTSSISSILNDYPDEDYSRIGYAASHHRQGKSTFESKHGLESITQDRSHGDRAVTELKDTSSNTHHGKKATSPSRFCYECGTRYPVKTAKFCCECGMKRMFV